LKRFEDYKNAVILAYQQKKADGSLPANLERHTPASLRNECLDEFPSRYSDKDSETFKLLFGKAENREEYYKKIKSSDPDIFKPLNNFLRGNVTNTNERNIHLLAWLIDFEPRPFKPVDPYALGEDDSPGQNRDDDPTPENADTGSGNSGEDNPDHHHPTPTDGTIKTFIDKVKTDEKGKSNNWGTGIFIRKRVPLTVLLLIAVSLLIIYMIFRPRYMYWNGTEYKTIGYFQYVPGATIVPFDSFRLNNLKKIKDQKIIMRSNIKNIYYSKTKGKVEFYTIAGENPEDTAKRLLPMTEYIYEKYVLKKGGQN